MLAIVCPGQGSQTPGFLAPWLELDGTRDLLASLSDAAGVDLIRHGTESDEETIKDTAVAQPLIVAAGLVAARLLRSELDGRDDLLFAGHSVGEITASALAGALSEDDAMSFVRTRATAMAQANGRKVDHRALPSLPTTTGSGRRRFPRAAVRHRQTDATTRSDGRRLTRSQSVRASVGMSLVRCPC